MTRQSTQHVSLRPQEKRALEVLADRLDRGNRSHLIARLIVRAAKEEIGADWERVVMTTPIPVPTTTPPTDKDLAA